MEHDYGSIEVSVETLVKPRFIGAPEWYFVNKCFKMVHLFYLAGVALDTYYASDSVFCKLRGPHTIRTVSVEA